MTYRRSAEDLRTEAPRVVRKRDRKQRTLAKNPKLVDFGIETYARLQAAAETLGLTESAFVRLAVHRAVEDIVVLYKEMLEAEARRQVDDVAQLYYRSRSHGKSGVLKAAVETDGGYRRMVEKLESIRLSTRAIMADMDRRQSRHSPKDWGPVMFRGSQLEQNAATLLLGPLEKRREGRNLLRLEQRVCLEDSIVRHVQRWIGLKLLQDRVVQQVFKGPETPGTEEKFYDDIVQRIDDAFGSKRHKSPDFADFIQQNSWSIYRHWGKSTWNTAVKKLRERSRRKKELETRNRQRALQALQALKADSARWLNPVALEKLLATEPKPVFKHQRVSLWPGPST